MEGRVGVMAGCVVVLFVYEYGGGKGEGVVGDVCCVRLYTRRGPRKKGGRRRN